MAFLDPSNIPSAEEVNQGHTNSDVDKSRLSQHHTLGTSATQASPGNHNHDGITSVKVKVTDLDGTLVATNGLPAGGSAGQILSKIDATNYNAQWVTNTAIQKGDGIYVLIRNNTGSTLTKGQIVYTNGATGAKVTVALALATGDSTSARTLGFVADDILHNDQGYVQIEGYLSGVDTASLTDGAQLYLSGTTAGAYQTTKPVAPIHLVYVGVVAKAASPAGGGAIMVKCQNGYELDEIHDVLVASKANLDVLSYESSTSLWKNKTLANAGIAALATANAFTVGGHTITNDAVGVIPIVLKGASGQTASFFEVQANAGNTLFRINSTGYGMTPLGFIGGGTTMATNARNTFYTAAAASIGLVIQGAASQTANLQEWQNSAGTVLGGRNALGQIFTGVTTPINYQVGGTPTATSGTGSIATITLTSASNLAVGDLIQATGFTTATGTYNTTGYAVVTAVSNTSPFTVSYAATGTGTASVFGQIQTIPQTTIAARGPATIPLIVKGNAYNVDMQRWLYPNGAVAAFINPYGTFVGNSSANQLNSDNGNNYILQTKGTSDQRGNHYQAINSSSTTIAGFNALGQIFTGSSTPILTASGGTIQSIATGANPLVTMASAHGFTVGDLVTLAGTTGGTYNGNFLVATTPLTTTFTITSTLTTGQAAAGGTVSDPAQLSVTPKSVGTTGVIVRGANGQSANMQEWQTWNGTTATTVANIDSAGNFTVAGQNFIATQFIRSNLDSASSIVLPGSQNVWIGGGTASLGGGSSVIGIRNAQTAPTSNPTGGGILYVDTGALKYRGTSGSAATIVNADGTMAGGSFTGGTLTSNLTLVAGNTSVFPLTFTANVGTPTPTAGVVEYDGTVFYQTSSTTPGRALNLQSYEYLLTTSYFPDYSVSGTAQSILNNPGVGITLVAGTTYEWELYVPFRYQSFGDATTFLSVGWNTSTVSGTPTVAFTEYLDYSSNTTSLATASTFSSLFKTTGTTQLVTSPGASGSRYGIWKSKGIIRVTGTGSIKFYPTLTASAATVNVITINNGTFFKLTPLGNGTVSTIGTWA